MPRGVRLLPSTLAVALVVVFGGCHGGERERAVDPGCAVGHVSLSQSGLRGDLNGNGTPDVSDAIGILRIVVGLDDADPLADCDGDGSVGVADAIMVLRCVVGLDEWPIGGGSTTIGPGGGTVTTVDGNARLDVPPGALPNATNITISPQPDYPVAAGVVPGTCFDFGPDGTAFSQPAQVTIAYDASALPAGKNERDLAIHRVVAGGWELVAGSVVDSDAGAVSAPVSGFSAYGLLAGGVAAAFDETMGPDGQVLVWVPAGSFMMGSDRFQSARPVHKVTLDGFWIGQCEVTHERYAAFLNAVRPGDEATLNRWISRDAEGVTWERYWDEVQGCHKPIYPVTAAPGYEQYPAILVTWEGAAVFCDHYGYALPTEAQWEYAARGPDGRRWVWGNLWDAAKCCNINNKGPDGKTFAIGNFPAGASWCGALDMAGNIFEWCADWYAEDYYAVSPEFNPQGPVTGTSRVRRGGSYYSGEGDCEAARRGISGIPGGFRVVRTP